MPVPILCVDEHVRHFAERFRKLFSKPQYQYARDRTAGADADVEGRRTLSGLLRQIADRPSLAGLSRFLSEAPWEAAMVVSLWLRHFRERPSVTQAVMKCKVGSKRRLSMSGEAIRAYL